MTGKRQWKNKKGYTLVEIIVTFGLTALFIGAATMVLSVFLKSYADVNTVAQAHTVSTTLMETIVSELSAAEDVPIPEKGEIRMYRGEDGAICYTDYHHYLVELSLDEEKHLQLTYSGVSHDEAPTEEGTEPQDTVWKYGEDVYNGFYIQELTVEQPQEAGVNDNCLTVTLKLKTDRLGDYLHQMTRTFECYNLKGAQIEV